MKIYSMTATFGKLEHETLTLEPGLNVFAGENEWGKSTWCAFLAAMFYGLDTRAKSTRTALADNSSVSKEVSGASQFKVFFRYYVSVAGGAHDFKSAP